MKTRGAGHRWTDEDAAFAVAQWCSGIKQREIAAIFGYNNPSMVCSTIEAFIRKYYAGVPRQRPEMYGGTGNPNKIDGYGGDRKAFAKIAFCHFMAQREEADGAR